MTGGARLRDCAALALLLAAAPSCAAEPNSSESAQSAERVAADDPTAINCSHCEDPGPGSDDPEGVLTAAHRRCSLAAANVRVGTIVAVDVTDPEAEAKLRCLAEAGDHEVLGFYARELMVTEPSRRPPGADQAAYRWGMAALRIYLRSVGVDFDRDDFFETYRAAAARDGIAHPSAPSDRIYAYSDVPHQLIERGRVSAPPTIAEKLRIIVRNRPRY